MERFSLDFELTDGVGWAHAKVMVGQATHETAVSYLTADPLGSFANALMALAWPEEGTIFVINRSAPDIGPEAFRAREFVWDDEPGGWRWVLSPADEGQAKLRIEELRGRLKPALPLIDAICSLEEMASACARCIENLAVKHGVVGYRLKWHGGDLPLSQYLLLRRWLKFPGINPTRVERGTWREDVAELQLLGA